MASEQATPGNGFRVHDDVALPTSHTSVKATARRTDRYGIHVTRSADATVERLKAILRAAKVSDARLAIVTDTTVADLHGEALSAALGRAGIIFDKYAIPPGEASKSLDRAIELWDWLAGSGVGRGDVVVTHGGGVINDLGGFVASVYMRGLRYVNLPTTLLAQVDGAMGGKVAVNHPSAKNLLGAFHQPIGVVSDVSTLSTLDRRHIAAGLAEAIKKAVIASPSYWEFIDQSVEAILDRDPEVLKRLVRYAASIKTTLIERDPYEEDLRRPLNFGHTVGHPLETVTGYGAVLHGEAVAFGMVVEARIAVNRGLLAREDLARLISVLERAGLGVSYDGLPVQFKGRKLLAATAPVERIRGGRLLPVLPISLGVTEIPDNVSAGEFETALAESGVPL